MKRTSSTTRNARGSAGPTAAHPSGRTASAPLAVGVLVALLVGLLVATAPPGRPARAAAGATAAAGSWTLVAAGDIACPAGSTPSRAFCQQMATANRVISAHPDDVLALGDLAYENGTLAAFNGPYQQSWGRFKGNTHPVVGNHEYNDPAGGAKGYFDYWNGVGKATGKAGQRGEGWYSYDVGAWHVVVLNSECGKPGATGGCGAGSPQYAWLKADLATHRSACTLAAFHRPRFTTGHHEGETAMGALWNLMVTAGVDVALNGHNHSTEIFAPIGVTPTGSREPVPSPTGIREFVAGNGGKELGSLKPFAGLGAGLKRALVARSNTAHGVLELSLRAGSYSWRELPVPGMAFRNPPGTTGPFAGTATCH